MSEPPFATSVTEKSVAVVGVGLIGGSICAALKKRQPEARVIGVGRRASRMEEARRAGLIDVPTTDLAQAAASADLVVFCTPVDRIAEGVREAAGHCREGALVTDAGSVKRALCDELDGTLPRGVTFIGSHPLAGSEKNGFEHADADLFEGRVCVVTPPPDVDAGPLDRLKEFWQRLGMRVVEMTPEEHDRAVARTSHVPHVAAAALAALLADPDFPLASTGFADTTRIAAGDPDLWTAILLENAAEVARGIDAYNALLAKYRAAVAAGDAAGLKKLLEEGKRNREALGEQSRGKPRR